MGGYYDENGNFVSVGMVNLNGFYDANGNWITLPPGDGGRIEMMLHKIFLLFTKRNGVHDDVHEPFMKFGEYLIQRPNFATVLKPFLEDSEAYDGMDPMMFANRIFDLEIKLHRQYTQATKHGSQITEGLTFEFFKYGLHKADATFRQVVEAYERYVK